MYSLFVVDLFRKMQFECQIDRFMLAYNLMGMPTHSEFVCSDVKNIQDVGINLEYYKSAFIAVAWQVSSYLDFTRVCYECFKYLFKLIIFYSKLKNIYFPL